MTRHISSETHEDDDFDIYKTDIRINDGWGYEGQVQGMGNTSQEAEEEASRRLEQWKEDHPESGGNESGGGEESSGGSFCFLTSACCEAMGLPDNCMELTLLREFRDGFLAKQRDGRRLTRDYYRMAPIIVRRINASPNRKQLHHQNYYRLVIPTIKLILLGRPEDAKAHYGKQTEELGRLLRVPYE